MKKLPFILLVLIALLNTVGCSTTTKSSNSNFIENGRPLGTHYLSKAQRQAQLLAIRSWTAQGNIAIHTNQKGWNASFNWQQQNQGNYTLALFGPLGCNRVQLTGSPGQVTLQMGNQSYSAVTPEALVQQRLGWDIPVTNLYYWLRGVAAPNIGARRSYDLNNHLVQLYQQDWHIIYLRYISVNGIDLPNRILLSNPRMQANIIITAWDL